MFGRFRKAVQPSKGTSIAAAFVRLGWTGFWIQVVLGSLPVLLLAFYFVFGQSGRVSRSGIPFIEYLTMFNLCILAFTLFWSYRYVRLGRQMKNPANRPTEETVIGVVWTGLTASSIGMLFSMLVLLVEAASLLFFFLKAPQGGIPVIQTGNGADAAFVSTVDMVSLMALILTLFAEILVMVFSLWLLFRTSLDSEEYPKESTTS